MRPRQLTCRFGSPLYVYQLDRLAGAVRELRAALPGAAALYYSVKANPHPDVVRSLLGHGCGMEVSSAGEIDSGRHAGVDGAGYLYTGPGKSEDEIDQALSAGVRLFSAESLVDLHRIGRRAAARQASVDCLLRVNARGARPAGGLRMAGVPSQFGFDLAAASQWAAAAGRAPGVRLAGLHFFPISNARSETALIAEFDRSIRAARELRDGFGIPTRLLYLGGGFAAPYASPGDPPRYANLRCELERMLDTHLPGWRRPPSVVAFESGRYLVAGAGTLVTTVMDVKFRGDETFVILDAGTNHLGGMSGLGRLLPPQPRPRLWRTGSDRDPAPGPDPGTAEPPRPAGAEPPRPAGAEPPRPGAAEPEAKRLTLVGPLCSPADVIGRGVRLDTPRAGDILTIPNVGAYGLSASLVAFLGRPLPAEIVLDGDRIVSVSRQVLHRQWSDPR